MKAKALLFFLIFMLMLPAFASGEDSLIRIGVLAKRGKDRCIEKWRPTVEYLTDIIPDYFFIVIPLNFDEILPAVECEDVDFIVANSYFYVDMEVRYGVSRIATLKNLRLGNEYTVFGGVVFHRAGREDIRKLDDLKGKSFASADRLSMGGWLMVLREFKEQGFNPYRDFSSIEFTGTHDDVVYAVRDGRIDAGSVRTDTLESMDMEGKINLNDFNVLELYTENTPLDLLCSTRYYPEWPFAKLKNTSDRLSEKITVALLSMTPDSKAAEAARCAGWTIPLNYQGVHECLKELKTGPYKDFGKVTFFEAFLQYWHWFAVIFLFLIISVIVTIYIMRLNRKLYESEKTARVLLDTPAAAVALFDTNSIIIDINHEFTERFGKSREELVGSSFFNLFTPDKAQENKLLTGKVINTGKSVHSEHMYKDRWNEAFIYPVFDSNSVVRRLVIFIQDITEHKQVQNILIESSRLEVASTLAGGIAHDFNNLMTEVIGSAELLKMDLGSEQDSIDMIDRIDNITQSAQQASDLAQQMLAFARSGEYRPAIMDLNDTVRKTLKSKSKSFPSHIRIEQELEPKLWPVMADPAQMSQVIVNICTNASESMEGEGNIIVSTRNINNDEAGKDSNINLPEGSYICLCIQDAGCGMNEETVTKVFEPFFTTKFQGRGLGLSAVYGIITKHNGQISIHSLEGKGTKTRVYLPVLKAEI